MIPYQPEVSTRGSLLRIVGWLLLAILLGLAATAMAQEPQRGALTAPPLAEPAPAAFRFSPTTNPRPTPAAFRFSPTASPQPAPAAFRISPPSPAVHQLGRPHHLHQLLLLADISVRALDVYSTSRMLSHGGREMFLPQAIASRPWAMGAFSAGMVGSEYLLRHKLPRRLSRWVPVADIAIVAPWAIRNLWIRGDAQSTQPIVTFRIK